MINLVILAAILGALLALLLTALLFVTLDNKKLKNNQYDRL